jgi:hypothetical protein
MLREDVVQAVAQGQFHIYAVSTIEEGIELLTGVAAGELDSEGHYPEGGIYARIEAKLEVYHLLLKDKEKDKAEAADPKALD